MVHQPMGALDESFACLLQVQQMKQKIENIPDGVHGARKPGKV